MSSITPASLASKVSSPSRRTPTHLPYACGLISGRWDNAREHATAKQASAVFAPPSVKAVIAACRRITALGGEALNGEAVLFLDLICQLLPHGLKQRINVSLDKILDD